MTRVGRERLRRATASPQLLDPIDPRQPLEEEEPLGRELRLRPTLRGFIAFDLSGPVRTEIARLIDTLAARPCSAQAGVRWEPPERLHLTLKFLGRVETAILPDIRLALASAIQPLQPLHLSIGGGGSFPDALRPRVLWLGIGGSVGLLGELAASIEKRLVPLGFPPENRAFSPHLTLGRIPSGNGAALAKELTELAADLKIELLARELVFFRSDAIPLGTRYTPLFRLPLGGPMRS